MILFEQDFKKYPTAIIDTQTTNQSFLDLAYLYRDMGIRNNAFHLTLLQPELSGWDPFDENLPIEIRAKMAFECKFNPWYFFREIVRLPPNSGPEPIQFKANRGNIALYWCFFNHIDGANIQPRQTGKSGSTDCLVVDLMYLTAENTKIMMITKDDMLRQFNIERLKGIRDWLPPWLYTITGEDANNQKELTCAALGNSYITGVGRSSETAANNLGRGLTSPILHIDEGPFISHIGTTLPAALAAGTAARAQAAEQNQPYGNIFTTTAGKIDDRDGRYMYEMIMGGTVWNEQYLDCKDLAELRVMMRRNCSGKKLLMNITMSHRQLGYSDEWLYNVMAENNSHGEEADRDFLNIWTSGTQRSPLSVMLNEAIRNSEMEVQHHEISPDRYMVRWFIPEEEIATRMANGHFSVGLDTSDAVGRDSIAMIVTDLSDLSTVAAGTFNESNLIRFAGFLVWFMDKYPTTTLIPERKSSGQAIIDYLLLRLPLLGHDPFRRIFNRIVDEYRENPKAYMELDRSLNMRDEAFYEQRKAAFGFNTTKESRTILYTTVLQNAAKTAGHLVRDKVLSNEIRGLVEKNGRIDHVTSGHDDHVIAWLLSHYLPSHGKNLQYYGIETNRIMTQLGENGRALSDEEREARARQERLMEEFEDIMDALKGDLDDLTIAKYEQRLHAISGRMQNRYEVNAQSLDAMITQAAEERRKRNQINVHQRRGRQEHSIPIFGSANRFMRQDNHLVRPARFY